MTEIRNFWENSPWIFSGGLFFSFFQCNLVFLTPPNLETVARYLGGENSEGALQKRGATLDIPHRVAPWVLEIRPFGAIAVCNSNSDSQITSDLIQWRPEHCVRGKFPQRGFRTTRFRNPPAWHFWAPGPFGPGTPKEFEKSPKGCPGVGRTLRGLWGSPGPPGTLSDSFRTLCPKHLLRLFLASKVIFNF